MRAIAIALLVSVALPAAAKPAKPRRVCRRESTLRTTEVAAALLSSPTWEADLGQLVSSLGQARVDCLVESEVEALMQLANLLADPSPVVPPYLAVGIERGRQWKRSHGRNADGAGSP